MDNELRHYGILGMKWGIRRTEAQLAKARGRVSELEDKLNKKTVGKSSSPTNTSSKKKSIKDMSDEELSAKIRRLQMEKQLSDLTKTEAKKVSKGHSFVADVLEKSGKNIATQAVTYGLGIAVNKAFAKVAGEDIVNPKKGQKDK